MKKTREEKAITLIALIITIVVLLILAVVAINAVTGDGIIQHATNAKESYGNAQAKEQGILSYYETYLETEGQVGKWIQTDNTITKVNEDGTAIKAVIGEEVTGINLPKNQGEAITWKLLGIENEKIILMSATNLKTETTDNTYTLKGAEGWYNARTLLDAACAANVNIDGTDAESIRSVNVDDINRVTGFNPSEEAGNGYGTEETWTSGYHFVLADGVPTAVEASGTNPIKVKYTGYVNTGSTYISEDSLAYNMIFDDTTDSDTEKKTYFLANNFIYRANYVMYRIGVIGYEQVVGDSLIKFRNENWEYNFEISHRLRAVIELKSDVNISRNAEGKLVIK